MPSRRTETPADQNEGSGSNLPAPLSITEDVLRDLLAAQQAAIDSPPKLSRIKVMPAGAGFFDFEGGEAQKKFTGVILHSHKRNVLWDKVFGDEPAGATDEKNLPACSSQDGVHGVPRPGFAHAALPVLASGAELVACGQCKYNQWGTGQMLNPRSSPKGKACTNQRAVYIMVEGEPAPRELTLPPTSIAGLDEYMNELLNRGIPVQGVITEFSQVVKSRPNSNVKWGVVQFANVGMLDMATFNKVMEARGVFERAMNPQNRPLATEDEVAEEVGEGRDGDNDIPF